MATEKKESTAPAAKAPTKSKLPDYKEYPCRLDIPTGKFEVKVADNHWVSKSTYDGLRKYIDKIADSRRAILIKRSGISLIAITSDNPPTLAGGGRIPSHEHLLEYNADLWMALSKLQAEADKAQQEYDTVMDAVYEGINNLVPQGKPILIIDSQPAAKKQDDDEETVATDDSVADNDDDEEVVADGDGEEYLPDMDEE